MDVYHFSGGTLLKRYKASFIVCLVLTILLTGAVGVSARGLQSKSPRTGPSVSSGSKVSIQASAPVVVNMQSVPKATAQSQAKGGHASTLPAHPGVSSTVYAQRKAAAAHYQNAVVEHPYATPTTKKQSASPLTPGLLTSFNGMSDSTSICPPFGCEPPDQALAVSYSWVLQGVNASFAVYNLSGALQPGWPKTAQSFFHIPNPGSCASNNPPFLSDPRAFYDQNDNRFWVAMLEVEGAPVGNNCPFKSTYWVAVSQNGNANGSWNIYSFNMSPGNTGDWADYTEFGFDQQAIYFSGNLFNSAGTAFDGAEYFSVRKHMMENGQAVTAYGFTGPSINGTDVDTVQPVLGESLQVGGPLGGQFIASEDINFGGGGCASGCSGVLILSLSNPGFSNVTASAAFVQTSSYSLPPNSDQPGCTACIDTNDTRIAGTPTWQRGMITFGLNTSVNNGTQNVPGIFWGQIAVSLDDSGAVTGGSVFQSGYFGLAGDASASFGALGTDSDGDLFMVYEYMSSSVNPSVAYTARRVTFTPGAFHDGGTVFGAGGAAYLGQRWGDFEAFSPTGVPFTDDVWFAGQYSNANGDWSTAIGHAKFVAGAS